MSLIPREELLLAGKKKLKNYQLRRQSMNNLKSDTATKPRPSSLCFDRPMASFNGLPTPTSPSREFLKHPTDYSLPLEPNMQLTPAAESPALEFSFNRSKPLRHERSQSVIDYSTQFPNTWEYTQKRSLEPLRNFDEAMVWMQQNSRLSTENQRLRKALDDERSCTIRLAETLAQTELELQAVTAGEEIRESEQERGLSLSEVEEMLRQVRAVERRRWSEIVERLERQVNQLGPNRSR
ncbi:hypothetical protein CLU79DRAFT_759941 [Phycomyces nitens]|nr:hypothetical protein CLU79DRAFT_759941 [Phycomyces nitens]